MIMEEVSSHVFPPVLPDVCVVVVGVVGDGDGLPCSGAWADRHGGRQLLGGEVDGLRWCCNYGALSRRGEARLSRGGGAGPLGVPGRHWSE